jgi:hypothetical protein
MKIAMLSLVVGSAALLVSTAKADLIAYWNFNASTAGTSGGLGTVDQPYPFAANAGAGSISSNFSINTVAGTTAQNTGDLGTFGGDLGNALFGDLAGGALALRAGSGVSGSSVTNNGKYVEFGISTASFGSDVILSYTTRGTGTGFQSQDWSYSTNGGVSYTAFTSVGGLTTTFAIKTIDFTAAGLGGVSDLRFRVTVNGATNTSGNNRLDNIQFNATRIPTPGSIALLGLGGLAAIRRRR